MMSHTEDSTFEPKKPMSQLLVAPLVLAFAIGCGGGASSKLARSSVDARGDEAHAFAKLEESVLERLAALDARIARRTQVPPSEAALRHVTMAAVLREDTTLAIVDGRIDPFSFDARARGLAEVQAQLGPRDGRDVAAARRDVAAASRLHSAPARASEHELLGRLVEQEVARLEEERQLPRSGSTLVRAIVETWQPPRSPEEAAVADRWLGRRLAELGDSVTSSRNTRTSLDVVRARELDDALDSLEHIGAAAGFGATTAELERLRRTLEEVASAPSTKPAASFDALAPRLRVHLGTPLAADELARRFASAEADLRQKAEEATKLGGLGQSELAEEVERYPFAAGPCSDEVAGSHVRSMAASDERAAACHLRHRVGASATERDRALALVAMLDHLVVAEWALDVARGACALGEAEARHPAFLPLGPDARARYERLAIVRPIVAIAAGETTVILLAGDPRLRAAAWSTVGDVPLDIAARELEESMGR